MLFQLTARRHAYRSIAIAANQPLSGWDQILPDKAMTVAAIDRPIHHAAILEMNAESFRQRAAASNRTALARAQATHIDDSQDKEDRRAQKHRTRNPAASNRPRCLPVTHKGVDALQMQDRNIWAPNHQMPGLNIKSAIGPRRSSAAIGRRRRAVP